MTDKPSDENPESMPLLAFKGRRAKADYISQEITGYAGNPFIEALPPILNEDEVMDALAYYPSYHDGERQFPSHLRVHLIQSALQLFAPLPVHLDLERRFSRMIRASYQLRNPFSPDFWREVKGGVEALESSVAVVRNRPRPSPLGFTIIGFPGVGKSTSIESILSLYPQVIYHSRYRDRDFTHAQIVWLKLDCPHDGSIKGLCLNFFQAVDDILGTNYEKNYAGGRRTVDDMLPQMARVAANHGIGVLVIDEIQRLSQAKSGGAKKMLNFFVQVANTIGVPVVQVGTFAAKAILSGEFHQIRRGTGQGDLVWDRMVEGVWVDGEDGQPGIWQLFLESLWKYQYVRNKCPLTEELSRVLYEETQGITDFAAKVYMLAQIRAIVTENETVTADIIRSVARDSLQQAQKVLDALRRGDLSSVSDVEDIHPIRIDAYITQAQKQLSAAGESKPPESNSEKGADADEGGAGISVTTSDAPQLLQAKGEEVTSKPDKRRTRRKRKSGDTPFEEGDLRSQAAVGLERGTPANESLQKAGFIQPATEYLDEEAA